jgi:hypothetical protein
VGWWWWEGRAGGGGGGARPPPPPPPPPSPDETLGLFARVWLKHRGGTDGQVDMRSSTAGRVQDGLGTEGATGLKALGVRELTYKLSFLACMVQPADARVRLTHTHARTPQRQQAL